MEIKLRDIIKDLDEQIETCLDPDDRSWSYEEGVLLTARQAAYIVSILKEVCKKE